MRKALVATIVIFLLVSMLSCSNISSITDAMAPNVCAFFVCPVDAHMDLKGHGYTIIEKDDFGRVLFKQDIRIHDEYVTYYFVLQRKDSRTVYFYENGFMLDSKSETELNSFKSSNDWNLPIDEEKLCSRSARITLDLVILADVVKCDIYKLEKDLLTLYNLEKSDLYYCGVTDFKEDKSLHWFTINGDSIQREIFVIVSNDNSIVDVFETDSSFSDIYAISDFKNKNGW